MSVLERQNKRDPALSAHSKKSCFPTRISTHCPFADAKKNVQEVFISPKKRWAKLTLPCFPRTKSPKSSGTLRDRVHMIRVGGAEDICDYHVDERPYKIC